MAHGRAAGAARRLRPATIARCCADVDALHASDTPADLPRALRLAGDALRGRPRPHARPHRRRRVASQSDARGARPRGAASRRTSICATSPVGNGERQRRHHRASPCAATRPTRPPYEVLVEVQSFRAHARDGDAGARVQDGEVGRAQRAHARRRRARAAALPRPGRRRRRAAGGAAQADAPRRACRSTTSPTRSCPSSASRRCCSSRDGNLFLEGALLLDENLERRQACAPAALRRGARRGALRRRDPRRLHARRAAAHATRSTSIRTAPAARSPSRGSVERARSSPRPAARPSAHALGGAQGPQHRRGSPLRARAGRRGGRLVVRRSRSSSRASATGKQARWRSASTLRRSDLPLRVAFPVLLINALDWFAGGDAGLVDLLRAPGAPGALPAPAAAPPSCGCARPTGRRTARRCTTAAPSLLASTRRLLSGDRRRPTSAARSAGRRRQPGATPRESAIAPRRAARPLGGQRAGARPSSGASACAASWWATSSRSRSLLAFVEWWTLQPAVTVMIAATRLASASPACALPARRGSFAARLARSRSARCSLLALCFAGAICRRAQQLVLQRGCCACCWSRGLALALAGPSTCGERRTVATVLARRRLGVDRRPRAGGRAAAASSERAPRAHGATTSLRAGHLRAPIRAVELPPDGAPLPPTRSRATTPSGRGSDLAAALHARPTGSIRPARCRARSLISDGNETEGDLRRRGASGGARAACASTASAFAPRRTTTRSLRARADAARRRQWARPFDVDGGVYGTRAQRGALTPLPRRVHQPARRPSGRSTLARRREPRSRGRPRSAQAGFTTFKAVVCAARGSRCRRRSPTTTPACALAGDQGRAARALRRGRAGGRSARTWRARSSARTSTSTCATRYGAAVARASSTRYDLVVLSRRGARRSSARRRWQALESYVRDLGGGFIMAGGENSFGSGGYTGTRLEKLLPVRFDPREEARRRPRWRWRWSSTVRLDGRRRRWSWPRSAARATAEMLAARRPDRRHRLRQRSRRRSCACSAPPTACAS